MSTKTLYLIRHGNYEITTKPPAEPDGTLTDTGREQATLAGHHLHSHPITALHHSTAQRAAETAALIAVYFPGLAITARADLRECVPSVPAGLEAQLAHIPPEFIAKSREQAPRAFATFFRPLANGESDQSEIIVSHGNLICYFISQIFQAPFDGWINADIGNCGISKVEIYGSGRVRLIYHNETSYLPAALHTY